MDIIGVGVQYKVVDTHDDRVRKIPLTQEESQEVVRNWYGRKPAPAKDLNIDYRKITLYSVSRIRELLAGYPKLGASLGNPVFEPDGVYTQDKVQILGEALAQAPLEKATQLIDAFTDLILFHWQYGFSDHVFNFTINNGVDKDGHVILLDFNEVTFDINAVEGAITSKRWLHSYSYLYDLPVQAEARFYFRHRLASKFTL